MPEIEDYKCASENCPKNMAFISLSRRLRENRQIHEMVNHVLPKVSPLLLANTLKICLRSF